jgi:hypothetical protein
MPMVRSYEINLLFSQSRFGMRIERMEKCEASPVSSMARAEAPNVVVQRKPPQTGETHKNVGAG